MVWETVDCHIAPATAGGRMGTTYLPVQSPPIRPVKHQSYMIIAQLHENLREKGTGLLPMPIYASGVFCRIPSEEEILNEQRDLRRILTPHALGLDHRGLTVHQQYVM